MSKALCVSRVKADASVNLHSIGCPRRRVLEEVRTSFYIRTYNPPIGKWRKSLEYVFTGGPNTKYPTDRHNAFGDLMPPA